MEALSTLIRINLKTQPFHSVWPSLHTETVFPNNENGTFWNKMLSRVEKFESALNNVDGENGTFWNRWRDNGHVHACSTILFVLYQAFKRFRVRGSVSVWTEQILSVFGVKLLQDSVWTENILGVFTFILHSTKLLVSDCVRAESN